MVRLTLAVLAVASLAAAQIPFTPVSASPDKLSLCSSLQLVAAKQLTFRQRACWYGSELASPWAAVRAGFSSGLGQWWNDPYMKREDADDYAHRFAVYYVKRNARETGELIAGYFNHEDPRSHPSGETAFKKRIHSALASVLITRDDAGSRPALGPIAGSLGSAFAGAACYREHTGAEYALRGAGITYSSYFGKALYQEFRPDISSLVTRMLHKRGD
ncbi:MAG TPA: hypothetical protein VMF91_18265 [Bryobacteraceae bacterium]|nr:hypothetical protein [Bryobacteraceae bacterium]